MNILVITGSPHKKGTSSLLADNFIAGALEAGHEVFRFDTIFQVTQPCLACNYCRKNNHKCIQEDDMELIWDKLIAADMVVFVTPVYYFGMSAQLKKVIDRFFAINDILRSKPKKAVLLATCGDNEAWAMEPLVAHYKAICKYLRWEDAGQVLAISVYDRAAIEATQYPEQARTLGKHIH